MGVNYDVSFSYANERYQLAISDSTDHSVKIEGVNYSVIGPQGKLDEVCERLKNLSLESVTSKKELIERLSSVKEISSQSVEQIRTIGKANLPLTSQRKSKEAEDVKTPPTAKMKRRGSVDGVSEISETEDLARKSSPMWECIGRTRDRFSNGFLYTFRVREEFNDLDPKAEEKGVPDNLLKYSEQMFPATDLPPSYVVRSFSNSRSREMPSLGYAFDETNGTLTLPDRETLLARWQPIRESWDNQRAQTIEMALENLNSEPLDEKEKEAIKKNFLEEFEKNVLRLPQLDIASSEGIADDKEFLLAFFTHHALLATGVEFVHDSLVHVFPTINRILERAVGAIGWGFDRTNIENEQEAVRNIRALYSQLTRAKRVLEEGSSALSPEERKFLSVNISKADKVLAALADVTSSGGFLSAERMKDWMKGRWGSDWNRYMAKQYGGADNVSPFIMERLLNQIALLGEEFDKTHAKRTEKSA